MKFVLFYAICLHYLLTGITKIQDTGQSNQFCIVVSLMLLFGIVWHLREEFYDK